jgi:hypothetical protein
MTFLSRVFTRVKESLETLFKSFFPEELLIFVLIDELRCSDFNIFEVVKDNLHGSIELELILDLNQVITLASVKTRDLDRNRNEVINDTLDDITDTILT